MILLANLKTFIRQVLPEFKVTSWSQEPSNDKLPSEKLVKDALNGKEDKIEPKTFTDLQSLITNASSGDIITLDKDYKYNATTDSSLSNGIVIEKTITINGNGHIIDGNNTQRAFYIDGQYTVNLYDLRIQNCGGSYGGAIYAIQGATININNTQFNQNSAEFGGAIFAYDGATVNITNTTFNQNNANDIGGAIDAYSSSTVTVRNSNFKGNTATNYGNIYCGTATTVYNCDINDISTTCYNVTNKPYLTDLPTASTSQAGTVQLVNDLTTGGTTKALTAEQGKELNTLIGNAITYINQ